MDHRKHSKTPTQSRYCCTVPRVAIRCAEGETASERRNRRRRRMRGRRGRRRKQMQKRCEAIAEERAHFPILITFALSSVREMPLTRAKRTNAKQPNKSDRLSLRCLCVRKGNDVPPAIRHFEYTTTEQMKCYVNWALCICFFFIRMNWGRMNERPRPTDRDGKTYCLLHRMQSICLRRSKIYKNKFFRRNYYSCGVSAFNGSY